MNDVSPSIFDGYLQPEGYIAPPDGEILIDPQLLNQGSNMLSNDVTPDAGGQDSPSTIAVRRRRPSLSINVRSGDFATAVEHSYSENQILVQDAQTSGAQTGINVMGDARFLPASIKSSIAHQEGAALAVARTQKINIASTAVGQSQQGGTPLSSGGQAQNPASNVHVPLPQGGCTAQSSDNVQLSRVDEAIRRHEQHFAERTSSNIPTVSGAPAAAVGTRNQHPKSNNLAPSSVQHLKYSNLALAPVDYRGNPVFRRGVQDPLYIRGYPDAQDRSRTVQTGTGHTTLHNIGRVLPLDGFGFAPNLNEAPCVFCHCEYDHDPDNFCDACWNIPRG
ncbi:hypothetical protein BJ878DRAFT_513165 [Calycina marina]|uniref:Uncharacterized protein n=1 Tax=Calycina marina TaxID=1763456 RepID=A0A9P7Z123_9HELO|nr:hypothetical protein BJ878DRAFT_513165 [Calycina marina]